MATQDERDDTDHVCPMCHKEAQAVFTAPAAAGVLIRRGHVHIVQRDTRRLCYYVHLKE